MKIKGMKRNRLDIIMTDLRPVELPKIFTVKYFYKYLSDKSNTTKGLVTALEIKGQKDAFGKEWHASPLKYHIIKKDNELREMSIPNPLSMLEVFCFMEKYEKDLLVHLQNDNFSIRVPKKNKELYYKQSHKNRVNYEYIDHKDNKAIQLEAAGNYFYISPFARLTKFYKSDLWFNLNRRYKYYGKLDFNRCFDSIYTHTYNWIIAGNTVDAKKFTNSHILSVLDRLLQSMNGSITNGIIVGPEFSRMVAEIILQVIDNEVLLELENMGYMKDTTYNISRYIDDIFIFSNSEFEINCIISKYIECAEKYHLKFNENKKEIGSLPHIWFEWKDRVCIFNERFIQKIFHNDGEEIKYLIKGKNLRTGDVVNNIKNQFQDIVVAHSHYKDKIVSYVMTTIFNKINDVSRNNNKTLLREEENDYTCFKLIDLIFYIYSFSTTFNNTEKVVSIMYLIEKEIGEDLTHEFLSKIAIRYDFIFENNIEDLVNLLVLFGCKKVEMNKSSEDKILKLLNKNNNPVLYAVYLIYSGYNLEYQNEIISLIERNINSQLKKIIDLNSFFIYKHIWWIYIFIDCPLISEVIKEDMKKKLRNVQQTLNKMSSSCLAKKEIIKFLLDDNYKLKFINWNIRKYEFYENVVFSTFDRTIFNTKYGNGAEQEFENY